MYVCMYVCMYICMYISMYVCMYACMHACICMYVYIMEEGIRITRAVGEEEELLLLYTIGGKDPYYTGGVRRRCYYMYRSLYCVEKIKN